MMLPYFSLSRLNPDYYQARTKKSSSRVHFGPNEDLKIIHNYAVDALKKQLTLLNISFTSATAFVKNGGIHRHFQRHVNDMGTFNKYWFVTDIAQAYASVNIPVLNEILFSLFIKDPNPYSYGTEEWEMMREFLEISPPPQYSLYHPVDLCHYLVDFFAHPVTKKGLAEGFPASPFLFNLYCEIVLDRNLRIWCEQYKITYSRFADDIIFTSEKPLTQKIRKELKQIIRSVFSIKQKKTLFFDIDRFPQGVILNKTLIRNRNGQAEMSLPGNKSREFKRLLYQAHYYPEQSNREILAGKFGTWYQKTQFLGKTLPEMSRVNKDILMMYRGLDSSNS